MEEVMVSDRWPLLMNPNRVEHGWWSFWEKARLAKAYELVVGITDRPAVAVSYTHLTLPTILLV